MCLEWAINDENKPDVFAEFTFLKPSFKFVLNIWGKKSNHRCNNQNIWVCRCTKNFNPWQFALFLHTPCFVYLRIQTMNWWSLHQQRSTTIRPDIPYSRAMLVRNFFHLCGRNQWTMLCVVCSRFVWHIQTHTHVRTARKPSAKLWSPPHLCTEYCTKRQLYIV